MALTINNQQTAVQPMASSSNSDQDRYVYNVHTIDFIRWGNKGGILVSSIGGSCDNQICIREQRIRSIR